MAEILIKYGTKIAELLLKDGKRWKAKSCDNTKIGKDGNDRNAERAKILLH